MKRIYSLPVVLLSVFASACWPYLADDYESYLDGSDGTGGTNVTGDDLSLVGQVTWISQRGTYWGEGSTDGELVGGLGIVYVVDSGPRSALARWAGGDGRCQPSSEVDDNYGLALDASDPGDVVLSGRAELTLPWLDERTFWGAAIEEGTNLGHGGTYDMDDVETAFGTLGMNDLLTTPRALSITEPVMTGSTPPSVGRSGMRLSWTNQANAVILGFTTVSEAGEVIDSIYCGVTGASDSFSLTLDDLPSLSTAGYTIVEMGNVSNGTGTVGDGITNEVATIHWQVGAVVP